jgi:glycosyltransferase involved in cell wall biosynthesis
MKSLNTTVLMPVHGEARYLDEAIYSVLAQTKKELELLIVFDRPELKVIQIVEKFQNMDKRIRSVYSTTPGISAALNLGLTECKTELVARLDCDDMMDSKRIEKQELLFLNENVVCVGSQLRIMNEDGRTVRFTHYPINSFGLKSSLRIRNVVAHPSVMFRKKAVDFAGGYRSEFNGAEDYDLWIRLSRIGDLVNIPEPLTNYRIHENQTSGRNKDIQVKLDANVRKNNYTKLTEKPGLLSALLINEAINRSGINRINKMVLAMFISPLAVARFLIWQYFPEVFSNDR